MLSPTPLGQSLSPKSGGGDCASIQNKCSSLPLWVNRHRGEVQSLSLGSLSIRNTERGHRALQSTVPAAQRAPRCVSWKPSSPHRFAKLHEDCTRSIPPLRRERRFYRFTQTHQFVMDRRRTTRRSPELSSFELRPAVRAARARARGAGAVAPGRWGGSTREGKPL